MDEFKYNVISLFSGAMGLDLGLEQTRRFQVVACVEKEPAFCETIRLNRAVGRLPPGLVVIESDVADIDPMALLETSGLRAGEVDVLAGGPPCQSFSTAGKRGTVQDPRGTMLWQFLRFVDALRPKFFIMENVRGLLSAALRHRPIAKRPERGGPPLEPDEEPGSVVRLFAEDLQKLDGASYHMDCFEVNAVNYGAPQLRERVIFIGNRYNSVVHFPDPTHGPPRTASSRQRTLFDDDRHKQGTLFNADGLLPWRTLGDAIRDLPVLNSLVMDFSPRKKRYLAMVPPGSNWRSQFRRKVWARRGIQKGDVRAGGAG